VLLAQLADEVADLVLAVEPADRRGEEREVLDEERRRDDARRSADGLQEADAPRVLRQPASDEDGHAGDGEQREEERSRLEHGLRVPDQQCVRGRDLLPAREVLAGPVGTGSTFEVLIDEGLGVVRGWQASG
jgi:hypothetical protein